MEPRLKGKRVCILAEDLFEDMELHYPLHRLREEAAAATVVGPEAKNYDGKKGTSIEADKAIDQVSADDFDALVVPGGYCPDKLRRNEKVLQLVRDMDGAGKPVAAICHAAWVLCSADIVDGRELTCFESIRDDVVNAGGNYKDAEVVIDGNLITSRFPPDLGAFCRAIIEALEDE